MKNYLIPVLFLAFPFASNCQWQDISIPTNKSLTNAVFTDDLRGYVSSNSYNTIWRTLDGGLSWDSTQFSETVVDLDFSSPMNGVALLFGSSMHLLKTTNDGGNTWTTLNFPNGPFENYYQVLSTSATNYYLISYTQVLKSTDAGVTWDTIAVTGYPYANDKEKINSDTLIFTGWDGSFNYEGAITYSYDGGNNWTFLPTNDPYTNFNGTHFITGMKGYGIYSSGWDPDTSFLAQTNDGGVIWNTIHFDTSTTYHDVYIKNNLEGYILTTDPTGTQGKIISTNDGINWNDELTPLPSMNRFYYAESTLWAIGENGKVVKKNLPLGIKAEEKTTVAIYPNPTDRFLNIKNNENAIIEIYSADGKIVFAKQVFANATIDLRDLPNGNYFISITTDNIGKQISKLIISH